MSDKKKEEFVVQDRRRFSIEDGEVHDNPDRSVEEPAESKPEAAATTAPPPPEQRKAEVREFPKREGAPEVQAEADKEPQAPPLTADERKAGDDAFAQSSKKIDEQIKSQLGRNSEEFQMSFDRFIASLYMTALMQLGLLQEQGGGQPRIDILGARSTIDTMLLLRDKTKGNLTPQEDTLLANSLYEVQMAYVEVTNAITRKVQPAPPGAVPNPFVKK